MRKSRARAIREQEMENPDGMSSASYRAAKRRHSNGLNKLSQPKPTNSSPGSGFPINRTQSIRTWKEKRSVLAVITTQYGGKGKKRIQIPGQVVYKLRNVTRVISKLRDHVV